MRISQPYKRFLRIGLLALVAVVAYWMCPSRAILAETVSIDPARQKDVRPPMFVLQVGIGKYQHTPTWAELRGAVTDVVEMRKVLESERWRVPAANIVTLTDSEGTKGNIFAKYESHLIANAKAYFNKTKKRDAVVMFQFSGHGSQAPDQDGDERDDGKDETLVTVNSQDAPGLNFDITDDEIYALTNKLKAYTDNIVYILDSCHSGSGTRDAEDVRRLPERKNKVVPIPGIIPATRSGDTKKPEDSESGVLPPGNDNYIVITAARANQLASQKNCFEECGETTRPVVYGNLTFYLIDELKNARNNTSYRELMENVTRRVTAEKPTQTPQIEGNKSRFVFGSLGSSEDNFVRIVEADTKKPNGTRTVKIRAGAMQGVTAGSIVAFYDKTVTRFEGAEKISAGSVSSVTPTESTVLLLRPKREITLDDKSVIVSPDLSSVRLKLDLDADASKMSAEEKAAIAAVRAHFSNSADADDRRGVILTTAATRSQGRWDAALLKDKFSVVSQRIGGGFSACELPTEKGKREPGETTAPDTEVFYFAGRDYVPMFRFCLESKLLDTGARDFASMRLKQAVTHLAAHKTVASIINKRSALNGKVTMKPIRLAGSYTCKNSTFIAETSEPAVIDPKSGMFAFQPRELFWFEVVNNSPKDVYLTLLNMAPDGSITIMSPRDNEGARQLMIPAGGRRIVPGDDCRLDSKGEIDDAGAIFTSRVTGLDKFKLVVSAEPTSRDDFQFLEIAALTRTGGSSLAGTNDWTTVETIFEIKDTGK